MKAKRLLSFFLSVLVLLAGMSLTAQASADDPLNSWTVRSPIPTGELINAVAYGNNTFVAVGEGGMILTSNDSGVNWDSRTSGITTDLLGIAYGAVNGTGTFVAVGDGGRILTSINNGAAWTEVTPAVTTGALYGVTYGNGLFVAVGTGVNCPILTSPDGVNWTSQESGMAGFLFGIAYGNNAFVAVGSANGGGNFRILTSKDNGVTWTSQIPSLPLNGIVYGDDMFVAVGGGGGVATSQDGDTWTTRTSNTTNDLEGVAFGSGTFVAVGYDVTLTSNNGTVWSPRIPVTSEELYGVAYGGANTFVAVGNDGKIQTSSDGVDWTVRSSATRGWLYEAAYGNGSFTAVGDYGVMTSPDGVLWIPRTSNYIDYESYSLFGAVYGSSTFVSVGYGGRIMTSADEGATWTTRTSGIATDLNGVAYGSSTFLTVGDGGTILTSDDNGDSWDSRTSGMVTDLYSVAYGNNTFVAVGRYGTILISTDNGATWIPEESDATEDLNGIAYVGGNTFAAVGNEGTILISTDDGASWILKTSNAGEDLNGLGYGNDALVAVGDRGTILVSADNGDTWTSSASGTTEDLYGAAYGGGSFIVAGGDGVILQSGSAAPVPTVTLQSVTVTGTKTVELAFDREIDPGTLPVAPLAHGQPFGLTEDGVNRLKSACLKADDPKVIQLTSEYALHGGAMIYVEYNADYGSVASTEGAEVESFWQIAVNTLPHPALPDVAFPSGTVGVPYSSDALKTGTTGDPTDSFENLGYSPLPDGLSISADGVISGVPGTAGTYDFVIRVYDSSYNCDVKQYTITIDVEATTTCAVTFESQGGSPVASLTNLAPGSKISAPAAPTKSGYTFDGWYKEPSCINAWNFSTDTVTGNLTLYAKWKANDIEATTTCAVTFDSQGGSPVASLTDLAPGSKISAPAAPTRSAYTFDGWYKEPACINAWNFSTDTVTSNITLYAKWTPVSGGNQDDNSTPTQSPEPSPAQGPAPGPRARVLDSNGNEIDSTAIVLDNSTGAVFVEVNSASLNSALDKSTLDEKGVKTAKLSIPEIDGAKAYESILPASFFASGNAARSVAIGTCIANVTLPGNMLAAADVSGAQKVSLTIAEADTSKLASNIRAQIGNRPVVDLFLKVDGKQTAWSNENVPVTVSISYKPTAEELKDSEHITVWYIDGSGNATAVPNGRYDAATGKVTFSTTHFSKYAVVFVQKAFTDLSDYGWAKKQIEILASKGIIPGTPGDTYNPSANITRADYLVMLVRTLGLTADFTGNFEDIDSGAYYYKEIGVAKKLGIADGIGNNKFAPEAAISRQDMMALTARVLEIFKNLKAEGTSVSLDKFSDKAEIADYAVESMAALVREGLIEGSGDTVKPLAKTSRAEAAAFLYKIYNKYHV